MTRARDISTVPMPTAQPVRFTRCWEDLLRLTAAVRKRKGRNWRASLRNLGWYSINTGGGCTALETEFQHGDSYALLTEGLLDQPDCVTEDWTIGLYDNKGDEITLWALTDNGPEWIQ